LPPFPTDTWFFAAAIPAVLLMGLAKGGFSGLGLLAMMLMSLVVSPVRAAAIMLPILVVQDVVTVWAYRKSFDRRLLLIMLPGTLAGVGLGWAVAARVSEDVVRLMVGLISIGFVALFWRPRAAPAAAAHGRPAAGVFWGTVSGFTSFVAHAGGPPFQVYVMPQRLTPELYAGTSTMFFAVTNALKLPAYLALGQFSADNIGASAVLFPLAIAATFAGVWLVRRIEARRFYGIIYALTFIVGLKLVVDGVRGLL